MQELKIKQTQDLELTPEQREEEDIKEIINTHGAIWYILFELFVLEDSMSISEFKIKFICCVIGLPTCIFFAYQGLKILSSFGGAN